ncbi:MAG: hypothetical protein NC344_10170 [Bacteroidales bacterium]|nr:hypothetical protein [Bacteroidales bacterium]MCM1148169.1 hypothetical protein [Bacteroidales bacterium]MCM1207104.1 hypothetical protein [Bacillota bacterium]MCM1510856.1 hypothetical protein [Clostridium sp.]
MTRTAKSDLRAVCKAICNTCYVDDDVAVALLVSNDMHPDAPTSGDFSAGIVRLAIEIVKGWVETSRSEGGISVARDTSQLNRNILYWSNRYGLEADELAQGVATVTNGSRMW